MEESFESTISFLFLVWIEDTLLLILLTSCLEFIICEYDDVTLTHLLTQSREDELD